jgi:AraC-like DNA-binding protein
MPLYDPVMPTRYATPLLELVRAQSPERVTELLVKCGVEAPGDAGQNRMLTMGQFDRLLCATTDLLARGDLGFELGLRIDLGSHDALSVAIRHCPTLHDLLTMVARYWGLITTCFVATYRRGKESAEWIVRPAAGMSRTALYVMEEVFAVSFCTDYLRLFGNRRGLDIYLSIPPPLHCARYKTLGPTRFHFDTGALPEVRCILPAPYVDLPRQAGAVGKNALSPGDPLAGEQLAAPTPLCGDWVTLMLREADGIQPSREMLADLLDVSPRTLSRNLAAEGIDLRRLANAIRFERACNMLSESTCTVTEIAYRLGYRDVASFTHAFQRMSGTSPRDFRNRNVHRLTVDA